MKTFIAVAIAAVGTTLFGSTKTAEAAPPGVIYYESPSYTPVPPVYYAPAPLYAPGPVLYSPGYVAPYSYGYGYSSPGLSISIGRGGGYWGGYGPRHNGHRHHHGHRHHGRRW